MVYCSDCGKPMPCGCRKNAETNKMIDPKKGTGKASKEVVQK